MLYQTFKNLFENYFNFSGRATRRQFWLAVLLTAVVVGGAVVAGSIPFVVMRLHLVPESWFWGMIIAGLGMAYLCGLFVVIMFGALVSLMSRRIHDAGFSEWVFFMPVAYALLCDLLVGVMAPWVIRMLYIAVGLWGLVLALMPSRARRK